MNTILASVMGSLAFLAQAAAPSAAPDRLPLPLDGSAFSASSMAFSAGGERICIAGNDSDEMGISAPQLMLVDRAHQTVLWRKTIPVPDGLASAYPVQCIAGSDRVYLLANAETSLSPTQAQSSAYVYAFDLRGEQIASRRLEVPGQSRYGYAMIEVSDGLKIAGYTREQDEQTERYATYTLALDARLQPRGTPQLRKNGAYTPPVGARVAGDSIYLAGRFFPAAVPKNALGEFMASRLKAEGGYIWSTRLAPVELVGARIAVEEDGTSYALSYGGETTTLAVVTSDGRAAAPLTYASAYCYPQAVARYGSAVLAVRERCKGKGNVLVSIDLSAGKERIVRAVSDDPLYVATKGTLWAVLARDKSGKSYLYSAAAGAW